MEKLKRYRVVIREVHRTPVVVFAANETDALEMAQDAILREEVESEYEYTQEAEEWNVEEIA